MKPIKPNHSRHLKLARQTKEIESPYLRGYCRVCNRHYFFRNRLNTDHFQYHQHHGGICQNCNYACARIKIKTGRQV